MTNPIEFFFDFSSPYGYLASRRTGEVEQSCGRPLVFRPYLMGAVFKTTGRKPLVNHPMVWDYARNDIERAARRYRIPYKLPNPFPVVTAGACRAFYWVESNEGADAARELAHRLYAAYFAEGRDISRSDVVIDVVSAGGRVPESVQEALDDESLKQMLREKTGEAAERGIFGSPFFIVDGEPFWGHDRIGDVIDWARSGGW